MVNILSPLTLLLSQCTCINYVPIHACIIPIHIYKYTCTHTSICVHTPLYAYTYSCACVYHLLSVDGRWDGNGAQDFKGYATAHHKHTKNLFCY